MRLGSVGWYGRSRTMTSPTKNVAHHQPNAAPAASAKMLRELRSLGYRIGSPRRRQDTPYDRPLIFDLFSGRVYRKEKQSPIRRFDASTIAEMRSRTRLTSPGRGAEEKTMPSR
jgi:hypothetical protein